MDRLQCVQLDQEQGLVPMAAITAGFKNTPLPLDEYHIRLLKFEHTAPKEPLRFSLRKYKFSDQLAYNALSYEWGDTAADRMIFVNDCPFLIRANLHNFLEVLAGSKHKNFLFFADAICINQNDIPERNAQVQRMGDLYRQAEMVLVWLGLGTADSDLIFNICADLGPSNLEKDDRSQKESKLESIDFNRPDGEALDTIYQRSYWTRLWIIQELFLAQEAIIFCGSKSTTWSVFRRLPRWNKGVFVPGGFTGVDMVLGSTPAGRHARDILDELDKKEQGKGLTNQSFYELVQKFGRAQCFDVRDRVYGLLGFASASDTKERGLEVVADYSATPVILFVNLLSTMPRILRLKDALDIFNILKLHHT